MDKPKILLIDDDEVFLELLLSMNEAQDYDISPLTSAGTALVILSKEPVDLIISDIQMPDMNGDQLFSQVQDLYPDLPVILVTAFGSTEDAIRAVKQGAFHYFEKPLNDKIELFWATVRQALAKREMLQELTSLRREKSLNIKPPVTIIGQSACMKKVLKSINEVADIPVNVLICGETGTGKELVAQAIHNKSERRNQSFFAVNCSEFAAGVLESELFGHEKGAFTGAVNQKAGLFDVVHKGSLFLDEIGEAPPFFQSKLLRVVETKTYMRVGGTTPIYSDFRLIVATNRNLEDEILNGRFRQDLFYRLNVYKIEVPPLRDRKEDIPMIAEFYLKRFSEAYRRSIDGISMDAMVQFREYHWPGNVRELINIIERAVITCQGNIITTKHLPFKTENLENLSDLNLKGAEKFFIEQALGRTQHNKSKASELLGISRKTLIEKIKIHGIDETADK
jgi:DNA-binding NtrC family response regulator